MMSIIVQYIYPMDTYNMIELFLMVNGSGIIFHLIFILRVVVIRDIIELEL